MHKPPPLRCARALPLAAALACAALARPARATTRYVDGTLAAPSCATYDPASRACGGGAATAYQTIEASFDAAAAGDTVEIRAGTYTVPDRRGPANSGRAGAPIVFRAFAGEAVQVRGTLDAVHAPSTTSSPFDLSGRSFVELEGLEVSAYGLCVRIDHATDIALRRMNIHDCGQGVWITNASARVTISDLVSARNSFRDGGASVNVRGATDVLVERATATSNAGDPSVGAVEGDGFHAEDPGNARIAFVDCVATDNEDDGFDLTGDAVRVERCVAARNIVGFKLWDEHCDPASCPPSPTMNRYTVINSASWANRETGLFAQNGPDVEIYNSVFAGNRYEGVRLMQNLATLPDPPAHAVMQNDILAANGSWGRRFESAGADNTDWVLTSDHNVFFGNGSDNAVWSGEDPSTLRDDPQFADAMTGDFHLRAGSPAIDSGRDLSALFDTDFSGATRPAGAGWDRGIFEYGATASGDAGTTASDAGSTAGDAGGDAATADGSDGAAMVDAGRDGGGGDGGRGATRDGCGCRAAGGARGAGGGIVLVLGAIVAVRRRRRRAGGSGRSRLAAGACALASACNPPGGTTSDASLADAQDVPQATCVRTFRVVAPIDVAIGADGSMAIIGSFAYADEGFGAGSVRAPTRLQGYVALYAPDGSLEWVRFLTSESDSAFQTGVIAPSGDVIALGDRSGRRDAVVPQLRRG